MLITFIQQLINGITLGAIYALIAIGYQLVFGVARVLNMAQGDILMMGAYFAFVTGMYVKGGILLSLMSAIIGAGLIGLIMERTALNPLKTTEKGGSIYTPLITTIGVSMALQSLAQKIYGSDPVRFPTFIKVINLQIGEIVIPSVQLVALITSGISMGLLMLLIQKTKMGKAIRASSESPEISSYFGINVSLIKMFTVVLASAMAGIGGVLYGMSYHMLSPMMGLMLGLKGLIILIVGGAGRMEGALIGGILLGTAEVLTSAYLTTLYRDGVAFTFLILILLIKPTGLFAELGSARK